MTEPLCHSEYSENGKVKENFRDVRTEKILFPKLQFKRIFRYFKYDLNDENYLP